MRGFFDEPSRKPLYKIFYGLNHSSVEAWLGWMKTQASNKQERAFGRLANYLEEAPKGLGSITLEVVKAVILFKHRDSFDVLVTLLRNSRNRWAQYKALNLFYEPAAVGLIDINPEQGKQVLLYELRKALDIPNSNHIKSFILGALNQIKDQQERLATLRIIVADKEFDLDTRKKSLEFISQIGADELFLTIEQEILRELETNDATELDFYQFCIEELFKQITNNSQEIRAWALIQASVQQDIFAARAIKFISKKILDTEFIIEGNQIYELIQVLNSRMLEELQICLEQRFSLDESEKNLVLEATEFNKLTQTNIVPEQSFSILEDIKDLDLPESFEKQYGKLKNLLDHKKRTSPLLLTGNFENDKLLSCKFIAQELARTMIILNSETLLLSPDSIDQLEDTIHNNRPCIVYLANCKSFLEQLVTKDNRRTEKLSKILKHYDSDPRVQIIYSLNQDLIDIEDQANKLASFIGDIDNDYFQSVMNL